MTDFLAEIQFLKIKNSEWYLKNHEQIKNLLIKWIVEIFIIYIELAKQDRIDLFSLNKFWLSDDEIKLTNFSTNYQEGPYEENKFRTPFDILSNLKPYIMFDKNSLNDFDVELTKANSSTSSNNSRKYDFPNMENLDLNNTDSFLIHFDKVISAQYIQAFFKSKIKIDSMNKLGKRKNKRKKGQRKDVQKIIHF